MRGLAGKRRSMLIGLYLSAWLAITLTSVAGLSAEGSESAVVDVGHELQMDSLGELLDVLAADPALRSLFASVALAEMISTYDEELQRAIAESGAGDSRRHHLASWYRGTAEYMRELERVAYNLNDSTNIEIVRDRTGVRLLLGADTVVINSPRITDNQALTDRIAQRVCELIPCDGKTQPLPDRVTTRMTAAEGGWSFSDREAPTYTMSDGLNCRFEDRKHLLAKKELCERLLNELWLLAEGLRGVGFSGASGDWRALGMLPGGSGQPYKITVDASRNYIQLRLPVLFRLDPELTAVRAWLASRLRGDGGMLDLHIANGVVYALN